MPTNQQKEDDADAVIDAAQRGSPGERKAAAAGLPAIAPDFGEQELADQFDNTVPAHGYHQQWVVALGGSAGSIPALRTFFENTPAASGLAYVVVLHLAPEHESTLPALLQRHSVMPVRAVEDSAILEANSVYVIPPGKHLSMVDGRLRLTDLLAERGKRVAVDLFFRSLADTHGPNAAAIVLSGADGDGATGLKRIKERGGLTIAQDPEEAEHGGMPTSAIDTGMVDWVLRAADMPGRILAYYERAARVQLPPEEGPQPAKAKEPTPDQSEASLREVLGLLRARTGRDFTYYKRATIVRRIARRMQVSGKEDLTEYLGHLRTHPGEAGALLQDLLISVTNFFRDRESFAVVEAYMQEVFRHRRKGEAVRVWCAACATGEEAYSMAMLLIEEARKMDNPPPLQVFGCDLDDEAIQTARAGFYPASIVADVSEERLRRFFIKEPGGYRVRRELREMVLFASHDLLKDAPFSRMDLISCRNLLIYLNREAQKRALEIFNFALKPGGLLFLGASETVEEGSALFTPLDKKHRLYRHRLAPRLGLPLPTDLGGGGIARVVRQHEQLKRAQITLPGRSFLPSLPPPSPEKDLTGNTLSANELHFRLLGRFGPSSIVVNADHDIIHLSENADRFLQLPEGEPTRNLLRLIHPMLRVDLRAALLRADETGEPVEIFRRLTELPGGLWAVDVSVLPAGDVAPGFLLLLFETHDPGAPEKADNPAQHGALEPMAVVQQLERELTRSNFNLRDTVEQYEASSEELKASNEELHAMNEELRSAGEELETGREELQSVNEELTTVNSEFKSRVEELGRTNSDLQNLMAATQIATVFLDRELRVMRYTLPAAPLFNLIPGDVGRPISDLKRRLDYPELAADAGQVLRTLVPVERELRDNGNAFLARVLPYRTVEDQIAGVVLSFVDITQRKRTEEELLTSEAWLTGQKAAFQAAVKGAPLETPLGILIRTAVKQLGRGVRCGIYLADGAGMELRHVAGMPDASAECVDCFRIGADSLACGLAVYRGQPVITPDVREEPLWKPWLWLAEKYYFRACWSFPIEAEGKGVGTLAMYFPDPREATARNHEFATVLTRAAAIIISHHQEVEERARAEAALRESEARFRAVANIVPDLLWSSEPDGRTTWYNERWLDYTGQNLTDAGTWTEAIHPEDREASERGYREAVESGRKLRQEHRLRRADGEYRSFLIRAEPLRGERGEVVRWYGSATDVDDLARARAALEAANQAKDHFLAVLSHELRTPLMPIAVALATLDRRPDLPEAVRQTHAMIRRNVDLEARFIDDLLDVTRITRGKMEIVRVDMDLHEAIRRAVEVSTPDVEARGQRLNVILEAEKCWLRGDLARLQQVFWNLLKNASKFTPEGGTITIRSHELPGEPHRVEITDTGIGLEAEAVERIFRPFEQANISITREFGGLGLGLAIAKATVEAHGGTLHASSPGPGHGATFTVALPLAAPNAESGPKSAPEERPGARPIREQS